ncbi:MULTISPECIES: phosphotransferase family protein [unclassified Streptosporangium]|uniref:phosphotransferase family protein n=1 Tax=unclassified Streptosporangium TaxID=2632669 RepID=UPI002E291BF8|nr:MULTISPECIES: aminoglycoside phosphotransferase family protein [unclassified Streptosporangium]
MLAAAGISLTAEGLTSHPGGTDSHVFTACHADGRALMVKVARHPRSRYDTTAWAAVTMAAAGIPVPVVVWHNQRICVETRCPGQALAPETTGQDTVTAQPPDAASRSAAITAGQILRRLHTVPAIGFGRLDPAGRSLYGSLHDWLLAPPPDAPPAAGGAGLRELTGTVEAVLRNHLYRLPEGAPQLLHGDCGARHVIACDGKVTGLVDLESVRGGDPLTDVAGWSLNEHPDLTASMFTGYFPQPPEVATSWALTLYRLRIAAALLCLHLRSGEPARARLRAAQIRADLADVADGTPRLVPLVTPTSLIKEPPCPVPSPPQQAGSPQ